MARPGEGRGRVGLSPVANGNSKYPRSGEGNWRGGGPVACLVSCASVVLGCCDVRGRRCTASTTASASRRNGGTTTRRSPPPGTRAETTTCWRRCTATLCRPRRRRPRSTSPGATSNPRPRGAPAPASPAFAPGPSTTWTTSSAAMRRATTTRPAGDTLGRRTTSRDGPWRTSWNRGLRGGADRGLYVDTIAR